MRLLDALKSIMTEQTDEQRLYRQIVSKAGKPSGYRIEDAGEGMSVANEVIRGYWKPRFLMDGRAGCACEFMDASEHLCTVSTEDIDWETLRTIPQDNLLFAQTRCAHYPTHVKNYENGVAMVSWQLNPDGMYFVDDDGFGMTDDEEVELYGFIDRKGKVLVKFRHIDGNWAELKTMRAEAERMAAGQKM